MEEEKRIKRGHYKRWHGYGSILEVPMPAYLIGILMGIADPDLASRYRFLPEDAEDRPANWLRGYNIDIRADEFRMDNGDRYPVAQARKIVVMARGRIHRETIEELTNRETRSDEDELCLAYAQYLQSLDYERRHDGEWTATFQEYLQGQTPGAERKRLLSLYEGYRDRFYYAQIAHQRMLEVKCS